ncbi:hypothetical protein Ddc_15247 [Ditylenchus destructor]|nr:hypothetical protein Ddc_15247 [Ditylenchus destructor]
MIATISKRPENGLNLGPSELNWEETPFICGTDICRDFQEYQKMDMRRLKCLDENGPHRFLDVSFVTACCSVSEARLNFHCSNFYLEEGRTNYEKGLYEEVYSVEASEDDYDFDDSMDEYIDEEESRKLLGHIFVAYDGCLEENDYYSFGKQQCAVDWSKWSGIKELCQTLPGACTFRSIAFYREISEICSFRHVLLIEVNRVMSNQSAARNSVNNIRSQTNVYIGLYKEVEFEMDLEALQTLVAVSQTVKCVGTSLSVLFRPMPKMLSEKSNLNDSTEFDPLDQISPMAIFPNYIDVNKNYTPFSKSPSIKRRISRRLSFGHRKNSAADRKKLSVIYNNNTRNSRGSSSDFEKTDSWSFGKNSSSICQEDRLNNNSPRSGFGEGSNRVQHQLVEEVRPTTSTSTGVITRIRKLLKWPFSPSKISAPNNSTAAEDNRNGNYMGQSADSSAKESKSPQAQQYGTFAKGKNAKVKFWTRNKSRGTTPKLNEMDLIMGNDMCMQQSIQC